MPQDYKNFIQDLDGPFQAVGVLRGAVAFRVVELIGILLPQLQDLLHFWGHASSSAVVVGWFRCLR